MMDSFHRRRLSRHEMILYLTDSRLKCENSPLSSTPIRLSVKNLDRDLYSLVEYLVPSALIYDYACDGETQSLDLWDWSAGDRPAPLEWAEPIPDPSLPTLEVEQIMSKLEALYTPAHNDRLYCQALWKIEKERVWEFAQGKDSDLPLSNQHWEEFCQGLARILIQQLLFLYARGKEAGNLAPLQYEIGMGEDLRFWRVERQQSLSKLLHPLDQSNIASARFVIPDGYSIQSFLGKYWNI